MYVKSPNEFAMKVAIAQLNEIRLLDGEATMQMKPLKTNLT